MSGTWPPNAPTTALNAPPSYLYQQYANDDNLQALVASFNANAQIFIDWFNQVGGQLPIYTSAAIAGPLLDWVGAGLYGLPRPSLASGQIITVGPLATWMPAQANVTLASITSAGQISNPTTTDDIYKRVLSWFFYKSDGFQFTIPWLKRRIMRFLTGANGVSPNVDDTYPVSIVFDGGYAITITITLIDAYGISLSAAQFLQTAINAGAVCMPFQLSEVVVVVNNLGPTGLGNNGGLLSVLDATGWPSSASGLSAGAAWDDGGTAAVVPGQTPNPFAQPQYFGLITAGGLLVLGGGDLPLSDPHVADQLWNDGGLIAISNG